MESPTAPMEALRPPAYVNEFVTSSDGLRLAKAFMRIARPAMRHRIVALVNEIVSGEGAADGRCPSDAKFPVKGVESDDNKERQWAEAQFKRNGRSAQ